MIVGEESAEVDVGIDELYATLADVERYPEWQPSVKSVEVLERDGSGRPLLIESLNDGKVKTIRLVLRYAYEPPERITWTLEDGDAKSAEGSYDLEALGSSRSRVNYRQEVDPGRKLSILLRGPMVEQARNAIMGTTLAELQKLLARDEK